MFRPTHLHLFFWLWLSPTAYADSTPSDPVSPPAADDEADVVLEVHEAPHPDLPHATGSETISPSQLLTVEAREAAQVITLVPGLIAQSVSGGEHPPQMFWRGFDADHGQDIGFFLEHMPLNMVGHPHAHGMVDLAGLIPETLTRIEADGGPFDPTQTGFSIAGTLSFHPALSESGFTIKASTGRFTQMRALFGWQSDTRDDTFVAASVEALRGYGENRASRRLNVMTRVGVGPEDFGGYLLAGATLGRWQSAGFVSLADVEAHEIGFFDATDPSQGGRTARGWLSAGASHTDGPTDWQFHTSLQGGLYAVQDNLTGFVEAEDGLGDGLHQKLESLTFHAQSLLRHHFSSPSSWKPAIEAGVFLRYDHGLRQADRLATATGIAVATELLERFDQTELSGWLGLLLSGGRIFHAQAALHVDSWFYGIDAPTGSIPHRSAQGAIFSPRVRWDVVLGKGHELSGAFGRGARALPLDAVQDAMKAPFADVWSADLGWSHTLSLPRLTQQFRLNAFTSHVSHEIIFDEHTNSGVDAGASHRWGVTVTEQFEPDDWLVRTSITATDARLESGVKGVAGERIPLLPQVMGRLDFGWHGRFHDVGFYPGASLTVLSPRLVEGDTSLPTSAVLDLAVGVGWRGFRFDLSATNVTNQQSAGAAGLWAANFKPDAQTQAVDTLQVSAAPPWGLMGTITLQSARF